MDSLTSNVASTLLALQIYQATRVLPPAHLRAPVVGKSFEGPDDASRRLQNWDFTEGFAVITESARKGHVIFECLYHRTRTRNTRKTRAEDKPKDGETRRLVRRGV